MNKPAGLPHSLPLVCLLLWITAYSTTAFAQSTPAITQPTPTPSPTPSLEKQFFRNILRDQEAIWTSPFKFSRGDAKWALPLGAATIALMTTDRRSADELGEHGDNLSRLRYSKDVSRMGAVYTTAGVAGAFYLFGRAGHNWRARETGILGAEALIDSGIVSAALKGITQRPRPRNIGAKDDWWDGGYSFPSGHAISSWALATVVANEYSDHRIVQVAAYGLATAVSISRYTGRNHFLSDVLVGSALGYGIGRYVYKKHHIREVTGPNDPQTAPSTETESTLFVAPMYSQANHTYGVSARWSW